MREKPINYKFWKRRTLQPEEDAFQPSEIEGLGCVALGDCEKCTQNLVHKALPFRWKPRSYENLTASGISPAVTNPNLPSTCIATSPTSKFPLPFWRTLSTRFRSSHDPVVFDTIPSHQVQSRRDHATAQLPDHWPTKTVEASSGAAARAAVAAHKSAWPSHSRGSRARNDGFQYQEVVSPHKARLIGQSLAKDTESGIGIDFPEQNGDSLDPSIPVIRKDPFGVFPSEITSAILSYLDATSLARAERVSRRWFNTASQRLVWRHAFKNDVQATTHNALIPGGGMPTQGAGLGKPIPDQDWKKMLKARKELQSRWRNGRAAAIYLEGHTDSVYCVQFDESKIITGSRDQTVRVWDTKTYRCIKMLGLPKRTTATIKPLISERNTGQPGRPTRVYFSQEHNMQASVGAGERHTGSILCLQFDEDIMVTGSSDRTCIVWDLKADYRFARRLIGHDTGVLDVCFDSKHIVSCSKDTTICLWNRHTGERIRCMRGHRGPVNSVRLRGELIVSASGDGVAKLWNLTSGLCIKEFPSRDRGMACVDFSIDSRTILAGGNDQVIYQFDTNSGELTRELNGFKNLVRSLHLDNANGRIVSGSYDMSVRAYDFMTGEQIVAFTSWTTSWILSAKADYRRIVAASQDSRTVIMDFGDGVDGIGLLAA